MKAGIAGLSACAILVVSGFSRTQAADEILTRIHAEATGHSQVQALFSTLTDQFGPRLAGSPAFKASAEWARDRMQAFGLSDPHLEPWTFGRGWVLDHQVVEMVEPRYMPLIGYAEAWSPSTRGDIVGTPVMAGGRAPAEVAAMKGRLAGAIVMTAPEAAFIRDDRPQPTLSDAPVRIGAPAPVAPRRPAAEARAIAETIREAGPAVTIRTSEGEHGTVFVLGRDQGDAAVPSIVLAGEHYNMIARMLARGIPVKLRVGVQAHFVADDPNSYNVIGEIPGTDPQLRSEVVMIGAHLDSWHSGTGAADNADGAAVMLETMRILHTLGLRPKRTIRVALWGGEEEGPPWIEGLRRPAPRGSRERGGRGRDGRVLQSRSGDRPDLRVVHAGQRAGQGALRRSGWNPSKRSPIFACAAMSSRGLAAPII